MDIVGVDQDGSRGNDLTAVPKVLLLVCGYGYHKKWCNRRSKYRQSGKTDNGVSQGAGKAGKRVGSRGAAVNCGNDSRDGGYTAMAGVAREGAETTAKAVAVTVTSPLVWKFLFPWYDTAVVESGNDSDDNEVAERIGEVASSPGLSGNSVMQVGAANVMGVFARD
ncbi:hypothetical protein GQ600_1610 [Phytophthora cactorum]|nr:hypothetical protein GQ600_1610 [Phytophthora cactorum]